MTRTVKKDIQNDRLDLSNIKMYKLYQDSRKEIDNSIQPIKPMKYTVNNVLNLKLSHVKNAPIMNSDKIRQPSIPPYKVFKGASVFPTLARDLKNGWRVS